jgi:hypothetical protein
VLEAGWPEFEISERIPLADIAQEHELVEHPVRLGRVVVVLGVSGNFNVLFPISPDHEAWQSFAILDCPC